MLGPSCGGGESNYLEEEQEEESVILTLVPVIEESQENGPVEHSVSSSLGLQPAVILPGGRQPPRRRKAPILPLPDILPPITKVSRDTLRYWCQKHNLSTDGQKIEVYKRLQRHAYPDQECAIPTTAVEAKIQSESRKHKNVARERLPRRCPGRQREKVNVMEVVTTAQESTMSAWARIAARAQQPSAVNFCSTTVPPEAFLPSAPGDRWCVTHGVLCPADVAGWVLLQFHAGHPWVPVTPRKMVSLLLLPACTFPSPGVEDNMLCPPCVKRNYKLVKRLVDEKTPLAPGDQGVAAPFEPL